MPAHQQTKVTSILRSLCFMLGLLILVYILSVGPVIAIFSYSTGYMSPDQIRLVNFLYAPLSWPAECSASYRNLFQSYVDLWLRLI
jgi:hypothetical protein